MLYGGYESKYLLDYVLFEMKNYERSVGLLFGSFNPIHNGHLQIAEYALRQLSNIYPNSTTEIWFVLTPASPYKINKSIIAEHRLRMLQIALNPYPYFTAEDIEMGLPSPQYTARTLKAIEEKNRNNNYALVMGGDVEKTIHTWKDYDSFKDIPKIVKSRASSSPSSTKVRKLLPNTNKVPLPPQVLSYIRKHQLFL